MRRAAFLLGAILACDSQAGTGSNTWRKVSSTPVSRFESFAVSDGAHLYVIGGLVDGGLVDGGPMMATPQPNAEVDILLVGTNRWSRGPDLPNESAKHHMAVVQYGGKIWVLGGFDGTMSTNTPVAASFVLEGNAWRRLKDAPVARGAGTAKAIGTKLYVAGGAPNEDAPSIAEVDVYDPASDAWSTVAPLPTPRAHVASCVIDGRFVVIGGWNEQREVQAIVEAYDPAANTWERWADLPTARGGMSGVTIDDRCYVIGGETWSMGPPATFAANEMFDSMSKRWAVLAPMPTPRHGLGLAAVGKEIWAVGGGPLQGNSYTTIIEAYQP
jgi:hypothetical protein